MGLRSSDEGGWEIGHAEAGHDATVKRCRELGEQIRKMLLPSGALDPTKLRVIASELEKMR